jgi:hypothetical protein
MTSIVMYITSEFGKKSVKDMIPAANINKHNVSLAELIPN